ncbi:MAG: hypothetical protein OXG05_11450 [Gammaproteobacteria bacterium]|nr:hypothetical protein [Gammaproteobacteria bacterium]
MPKSILKKRSIDEYLKDLDSACTWLNIEQGRAAEYRQLLEESRGMSALGEDQLLAYFESLDLVETFLLWGSRVNQFPKLKEKIRQIYRKGPLLRRDEYPSSNPNQFRNNAFPILLAGRFLVAGIPVNHVDELYKKGFNGTSSADFIFSWNSSPTHVQCKRPFSKERLVERAKEARNQIKNSGRNGIVALDCSLLIYDNDVVFRNADETFAVEYCSNFMVNELFPKVQIVLSHKNVLGLILYSRVPSMTPMEQNGDDGQMDRRDASMSFNCFANQGYSTDKELMLEITDRLDRCSRGVALPPLVIW